MKKNNPLSVAADVAVLLLVAAIPVTAILRAVQSRKAKAQRLADLQSDLDSDYDFDYDYETEDDDEEI